ncbi:MAG: helix-hairpin-helix domain-containing protein [Bacillota bacterium]|jgi:competence protein ComEA
MLPEIKKQHLIIFVVMLALLFGGGVTYGRYLEKKALPPVSLTWADDSLTEKGNAQGYEGEPKNLQKAQVEVLVHVAGAVERPGVYTLPEGSRIIDAVELAQPKTDADLNKINLAKKINDQEMIIVPGFGEEGNESVVHPASIGSSSNSPVSAEVGGLININTASQAELETLPGIGPAKAQAIIQYREENGYFSAVEDIQNVSGIGPATFNKLKNLITT